ncbi:MAG: OmpA family protein [Nitrospiria bacterium]
MLKISGKTIGRIVLICSILGLVSPGDPSEIVMESYQYESDMPVRFQEGKLFVICDCPEAGTPALTPIMPPLALKLSASNRPPAQRSLSNHRESFKTTITFAFDSDRLTPSEEEKVKKAIAKIKAISGRPQIQILGHTSELGTAAYNRDLSKRRAESVAALFRSGQLDPEAVAGKGSCCPVSKTRSLNRRVEIIVQQGEPL